MAIHWSYGNGLLRQVGRCTPRHQPGYSTHQRAILVRRLRKITLGNAGRKCTKAPATIQHTTIIGRDRYFILDKSGTRHGSSKFNIVYDTPSNAKDALRHAYASRPSLPMHNCIYNAMMGTDAQTVTHWQQSNPKFERANRIPKRIAIIGMGFRGWGVDYVGHTLPTSEEQRMMVSRH
jgi:hypothetical protein